MLLSAPVDGVEGVQRKDRSCLTVAVMTAASALGFLEQDVDPFDGRVVEPECATADQQAAAGAGERVSP
jgi:hypothetical protein